MATLSIAGIRIPRGSVRRLDIPVARLSTGTFLSLPVRVVRGRKAGPTVWLDAALHGDEINGVEIIREVLEQLDPDHLRGTVIAVPIVNVFGFVAENRYLPDRRDLNRSFPGSPAGSLARRLAHLFMQEIVTQCTYGIDLHTGSDDRTNHPHIRANLKDRETRRLAEAFGAPLMLHSKTIDGSLRAAAGKLGIRCLVYEAGEAGRFNADAVDHGVHGILRFLAALRMGVDAPALEAESVRVEKTRWVRANQGGVLRLRVAPGQRLKRGQIIGTISDAFGDEGMTLKAPAAGVVLGLTEHPLVHRGDAVVHIATRGG